MSTTNTATNVSTGKPAKNGAMFFAPLGTTIPTDADETLDAAFVPLGYVSEDGVTNDNSPESNQIKAWGGNTVLNTQTDRADSFGYTLIESLNINVLKRVYGDDNVIVGANGDIHIKATADQLEGGVWVIDILMRDNRKKRVVIPNGTVSEIGTITYNDTDAVGYELTIQAVPDEDGCYHHEYIKAAGASI